MILSSTVFAVKAKMQQLKSLALEAIKTANTHNFYVSNIVWMHKITCKYV